MACMEAPEEQGGPPINNREGPHENPPSRGPIRVKKGPPAGHWGGSVCERLRRAPGSLGKLIGVDLAEGSCHLD